LQNGCQEISHQNIVEERAVGLSTDAYIFFGIDAVMSQEEGIEPPAYQELKEDPCIHDWLEDQCVGSVGVGSHCSGYYPIYYLYLHQKHAWRGYPQQLPKEFLAFEPTPRQLADLKQTLENLGIPERMEDLGWYLASYMD
jgi:hypothetical protein